MTAHTHAHSFTAWPTQRDSDSHTAASEGGSKHKHPPASRGPAPGRHPGWRRTPAVVENEGAHTLERGRAAANDALWAALDIEQGQERRRGRCEAGQQLDQLAALFTCMLSSPLSPPMQAHTGPQPHISDTPTWSQILSGCPVCGGEGRRERRGESLEGDRQGTASQLERGTHKTQTMPFTHTNNAVVTGSRGRGRDSTATLASTTPNTHPRSRTRR